MVELQRISRMLRRKKDSPWLTDTQFLHLPISYDLVWKAQIVNKVTWFLWWYKAIISAWQSQNCFFATCLFQTSLILSILSSWPSPTLPWIFTFRRNSFWMIFLEFFFSAFKSLLPFWEKIIPAHPLILTCILTVSVAKKIFWFLLLVMYVMSLEHFLVDVLL